MWSDHVHLKQGLIYPAFAKAGVSHEAIDEARIEGDLVAILLGDLAYRGPDDRMCNAVLNVLHRALQRGSEIDEDTRKGLFAQAKKAEVDFEELGKALQSRPSGSVHHGESGRSLPVPRYLCRAGTPSMEHPKRPEREGDERERSAEEDDRRGRGSRHQHDDERRYSRRREHSSERGRYGDTGGHSEAAQRGWEARDERYDDFDDGDRRRAYSPEPDYDDDRQMSRGRRSGGWYGDPQGRSEAAHRSWDDPDHRPSGWYGDRERHSEAARQGWDERRSRYEDDDFDYRRRPRRRNDY